MLSDAFHVKVYVSFEDWKHIPREKFETIDEWHADEERKYLVGILPFTELKENTWWKENNVSLILFPDGVIEDMDARKIKKRSLELAGIV